MQVSRIEIFGFKSFMERLVLPIEQGITGVVGPNGCGKSNIVDAIRWVLGETRARSLRGGVLEDVIFNGTDKFRPLGLAEVTITLKASSENFFSDLVSPALEAELLAEEATAALEDELSSEESSEEETATAEGVEEVTAEEEGSESDSDSTLAPKLRVIEGNLGKESLEEPSVDLAELQSQESEESGPQGKERIESKGIQVSASMLHRFSWLKSCSEVQVTRRLYRSGESEFFINRVQCRLKDVKELFRAVGLGPRAYTLVAQGEVARIITAKPEDRRSILEEAAGVQGFRDKIAASKRRLDETELNISRIDDILKEVVRQVNSLKRQASKARNRKSLKDEIASIEKTLFGDAYIRMREESQKIEATFAESKQLEQSLNAEFQKERAREEEARNLLMSIDVEGDELRSRIDGIKEELNARARQRGERAARISELEAFRKAKGTELKRLEERGETLGSRSEDSERSLAELQGQERVLSEKVQAIDLSGEESLKELARRLESLRSQLKEKERSLRTVREDFVSKKSSLESIEEQLVAASPVEQLKQSLDSSEFSELKNRTEGARLLVDGLRIPEQYTKAVQAVIGEKAGFLVADDPHGIARGFRGAVEKATSARGLGLGVLRSGGRDTGRQNEVPFPALVSLIEIDDSCRAAAESVLRDVHIVEDAEQAFEYFLQGQSSDTLVLVSLAGEVITANSYYALHHEAGVVQLKQRADTLRVAIAELEAVVAATQSERNSLSHEIEAAEGEHSRLLKDVQAKQSESRELSNQLGNVRGRLQAESRVSEQIKSDQERLQRQQEEAKSSLEQYGVEVEKVRAELEAMQSDDESEMHAELRELNSEYATLDEKRSAERKVLAELASTVSEKRNELDRARTRLSDCELKAQKVELEREHIAERVLEEYGEELLQELAKNSQEGECLAPEVRSELKEKVSKLKTRIAREGEVDPTSIERLDEEQTRLDDLQTQRDDLHKAARTLERTIETLTETSEKRFIETFEAVQENFAKLTPRLFGGGSGSIELLDPSKPLETGVEIIARPPGKKLKSIELLSGGEKALCATALVFSMFLERPSPLCVLDEVDAPLDEANLFRFVSLVKELSTKTQFIMITHNKGSMALADKLVGVTMPQPGASRVISVSLQEAYEQVA